MSKQRPIAVKCLDQTSQTGASSFQGQGARAKNSSTHCGHCGHLVLSLLSADIPLLLLGIFPFPTSSQKHCMVPVSTCPTSPPIPPAPPCRRPWGASLPGHAFLPLRGSTKLRAQPLLSSHYKPSAVICLLAWFQPPLTQSWWPVNVGFFKQFSCLPSRTSQ